MRFANVPPVKPERERQAASEFVRKLMAMDRKAAEPAEPAKDAADLPLDQRVRLVGEW